jgi:hypothetical protein
MQITVVSVLALAPLSLAVILLAIIELLRVIPQD